MKYFNRYNVQEEVNNIPKIMPFISLKNKSTDKSIIWDGSRRLDVISSKYYGSPYFDWLIMLKNSDKGMDEFEWKEGSQVIIPYPLDESLDQYRLEYERYVKIEG